MKHHIEFEVGERYKNRKGTYEVLEIAGDAMRIRWETGEEIDTTAKLQSRILDHMQQGSGQLTLSSVKSPPKKNDKSHGWSRVQRS